MENWQLHLKKGKDLLLQNRPDIALKEFHQALEGCPVEESRQLSKILFYIGVVLKKVGVPNGALKSWLMAQKITKNDINTRMIKRYCNDYGMVKQSSEYLDDWEAFHSLQLSKYLECKREGRFNTPAEFDVVNEIIAECWEQMCTNYPLRTMSLDEKVELFRKTSPDFPVVRGVDFTDNRCIDVNFREQRRYSPSDRCSCGSNLPYSMCCGRIEGEDELIFGSF